MPDTIYIKHGKIFLCDYTPRTVITPSNTYRQTLYNTRKHKEVRPSYNYIARKQVQNI